MPSKNTTHLAGEFLVAGELSRRGYPVSITFGNAKAVDIYADTKSGPVVIDAKAGRTKSNFPIKKENINKRQYYIFVYLKTKEDIENNIPPVYFIVTGKEIIDNNLITAWKTRQGIKQTDLNTKKYKERWDKLPPIS